MNMDSIGVGSLVRFSWWSDYKAPSEYLDANGHVTWHEVKNGSMGIVIYEYPEGDFFSVLFSKVNVSLKMHRSMLESI